MGPGMAARRPAAVARPVQEGGATMALESEIDGRRPFIKWAGGKRQLLSSLLRYAPRDAATYFEPFVGGGALFFALRPNRAVLADVNERLVRTYRGVRNNVEEVIKLLKGYPHTSTFFYKFREKEIDSASDAEVAA